MPSPPSSPAPGLRVCSPSIVEVVANDVGSLLSYSPTLEINCQPNHGYLYHGTVIKVIIIIMLVMIIMVIMVTVLTSSSCERYSL